MAKKKSKKKPAARRMGAMALNASNPLIMYGSIAAGFLLGDKINEAIDKAVPADKVDPKLVAAGEVGLGALLLFRKGKKNMVTVVAGGIALGAGAKRALKSFGIISGYQMIPAVNGYQDIKAVNGSRTRRGINGSNPGGSGMGWNTRLDLAASGNGLTGGRG